MSNTMLTRVRLAAALGAYAVCFWPVWRWFAARLTDGSDEPWGLAALAAGVACSWPRDRRFRFVSTDPLVGAAACLTAAYVVLLFTAPPIVRAIAALAAIGCLWVSLANARERAPVVIALFVLSLPLIASLQFYVGYPLRAMTAEGATRLLNAVGFDIARSGTAMTWNGRLVLVDAPCSGVRMLWTASCLACVLAAQRARVRVSQLVLVLTAVIPVVLVANMLRAAALFVLETRFASVSDVVHVTVGVAAFALLGWALFGVECLARGATLSQVSTVSDR